MKTLLEENNIKKFENNQLIKTLTKKKQNLSKEKIFHELCDKQGMQNHIKKLKKLINIFKFNYKASTEKLADMKGEQNTFLNKRNQRNSHFINKNNIITNSFGYKDPLSYQNLENLYNIFEERKKYEILLRAQMIKIRKKLEQILKNNYSFNNLKKLNYFENDEDINEIINFGISEDNPYFSGDENNIPENTNKFNNVQFGNFAYILFKNFESKQILLDESQTKIINPFLQNLDKKGVKKIKYKNKSFNFIVEEMTKIMMNALENINKKNKQLISIFIGALLYN